MSCRYIAIIIIIPTFLPLVGLPLVKELYNIYTTTMQTWYTLIPLAEGSHGDLFQSLYRIITSPEALSEKRKICG